MNFLLPVFLYARICSCLLWSRLLALTLIMQVEILDGVLGDLSTLLPSEVDTVAIVNATKDAGQAEERLEIIEVTGGYREADGAGSCLARQGDWWDILPVEVLEHLDDGSGFDSVIGRLFRMWRGGKEAGPIAALEV